MCVYICTHICTQKKINPTVGLQLVSKLWLSFIFFSFFPIDYYKYALHLQFKKIIVEL